MVPSNSQKVIGLGEFPIDWAIAYADDLSTKITKGTTPPKSEITEQPNIPFLRVNNLDFNGELKKSSDMIYVTEEAHNNYLSRSIAYPGDILMSIVGPPLGKIALLDNSFPQYNMNQAIVFYRLDPNKIEKKYFLNYLLNDPAQNWFQSRSKKTSGQQNLTIQIAKELPVAVPPLPEQQKIAKILTTWDKAINTTERLIENSKQQKKALMQQLLTGQKRLLNDSGQRFSGGWCTLKVEEIGQIVTGSTPPKNDSSNYGDEVSWATADDFKQKYIIDTKVKLSRSGASKARLVPKGSVLVTCIASIGKNAIANEQLATNQQINAVVVNENHSNEFFYYLMGFNTHKLLAWAGTTAVPILNKTSFGKLSFNFPSLEEQQKIAAVLTNADREIEVLEQQLADLQQEKKALMQQLLTGKKRVLVD